MAKAIPTGSTVVLVGTRKGAFLFHSKDRRRLSMVGPYFEGKAIYHMMVDSRNGRTAHASVNDAYWGPGVQKARVGGAFRRSESGLKFDPSTLQQSSRR